MNSAVERYFRCNDEYGDYLGDAMAESGRFSMFIDQPKTLSGEGRLEVYRALNRLRYVSNYYFFFLSLSPLLLPN